MIDWLVNKIFGWTTLREAIFDEVHMYDQLSERLKDPDSMATGAVFWSDEDGWRGWSYEEDTNKYYFNDVPEVGMLSVWASIEEMKSTK